jgi:replicative DNA helicase
MERINSGTKSLKTTYKQLSHFVDIERQKMELEAQGIVVDLVPCNMPSFYSYYIPRPSTFGIITGISSMGKTQLALMIAFGHAIYLYENKLPGLVTINELESVGWRLNRRMACCLAGVDSRNLAGGLATESELRRYNAVLEYFTNLPIYIDDNPDITTDQFAASAISLHLEKGPRKIGVSDYLELFADKGKSEELRVSQAVRQIRKIGWNTGAAEIVISQLNNSVMMTDSKIGGISRTRYSGAIGQAADWFLEVYNPISMRRANIDFTLPEGFVDDMAYVLVQKNKDFPTGHFPMEWYPEFTRFRDPELAPGRVFAA